MSLLSIVLLVLAASGVLMVALHLAYASPKTDPIKLYASKPRRLPWIKLARSVVLNSLVSAGLTLGVTLLFASRLIASEPGSAIAVVADVGLAIVVYDFLYYFMHRYLFHEWKPLRAVHVVHHTNKQPTAFESLYAHPLEMAMGVIVLLISVALVGPVSLLAFALILMVFTFSNLLIHSGLDFRRPGLRFIGYMNRKHARHHTGMRAGNYASITPLPDILFGTSE